MKLATIALTLGAIGAAQTSSAQFQIYFELVPVQAGATTSPFVTPDPYDVWELVVTNPNPSPATSIEFAVEGPFLGTADTTFKVGSDIPVVFGFDAPDTFFVLPDGVDPADVLAVDVEDSATRLAASYTVAGGAELLPGGGVSTTLATLSTPAGANVINDSNLVGGRAVVDGEFVCIGNLGFQGFCARQEVPEPAGALLAAVASIFARLRRW